MTQIHPFFDKGVWLIRLMCLMLITSCSKGEAPRALATINSPMERCETEIPQDNEDIVDYKQGRVKYDNGDAYLCKKGRWEFYTSIRRQQFKTKITKTAHSCQATDIRTNKSVPLITDFSYNFEVSSFLQLFGKDGWSHFTLLSPKANSVKKYVALRRKIFAGADFLDNRIDIETINPHSGKSAVRFYTAPTNNQVSKSLVEKVNLCFGKGDDVWFSGWFFIQKGMPSTLFDFETRKYKQGPGIRLYIRNSKFATMELKHALKPQYNQTNVQVPIKKWFQLKLHMKLSNHEDGLIELWQDNIKILSLNGQNLPFHDTIYHTLQVGITATRKETVLLVDDVTVSNKSF